MSTMNSDSVKEMFPDWAEIEPGMWSIYSKCLTYGLGHDLEIGLYEYGFYTVVDENHCDVKYTAFWVGGKRDGEVLRYFGDLKGAMDFAWKFGNEHEEEFDPVWGGVAILDESGNVVEW